MTDKSKKYKNQDITIEWMPEKCIHSKLCWQGLVQVFNPKERPWVNMDGATTQEIINQVKQCPSGALSYKNNQPVEFMEETITSETIVEATPNGPLLIFGNITIKDAKGETNKKSNVTALCRCGHSENKPFCDGAHRKIGFKD